MTRQKTQIEDTNPHTTPDSLFGNTAFTYSLLWFAYIVLLMCDLYWGKSGLGRLYGPSIAFEPLAPKAAYSLLVAAVAGGLAYCRGLLGKVKPHRRYLICAATAALITFGRLVSAADDRFWDQILSIPGAWIAAVLLHLFFYSPLIGLARLVPGFDIRILYTDYDPLSAVVIVLMYAGISVCGYRTGQKARERAAEDAGQPQPEADLAQSEQVPPDASGDIPLPLRPEKLSRRLRRRLPAVCCALSVLFFVLWAAQAQDKSGLTLLVKSSADAVQHSLSEFRSTGDEGDYRRAAADFRAFEQAYSLFCEKAGRPESAAQCREICNVLLTDPEKAKPHLEEIYDRMRFWEYSVGAEKSYEQMAELHAILTP
ncbi:MAG TPA: hypothetical protein VN446_00515 [Candidatus Acidoferrum sp.]|nr:hypothetical protein [Candidatus Acidoferrum sp.]